MCTASSPRRPIRSTPPKIADTTTGRCLAAALLCRLISAPTMSYDQPIEDVFAPGLGSAVVSDGRLWDTMHTHTWQIVAFQPTRQYLVMYNCQLSSDAPAGLWLEKCETGPHQATSDGVARCGVSHPEAVCLAAELSPERVPREYPAKSLGRYFDMLSYSLSRDVRAVSQRGQIDVRCCRIRMLQFGTVLRTMTAAS